MTALGAVSFFGSSFIKAGLIKSYSGIEKKPDISVITGKDYFNATIKAVKQLGGIRKFVPENSKVGILINSDFDIKGAYVNPDISIAIIKMCIDAGVSEICCLQNVKEKYWKRSQYFEKYKEKIAGINNITANQFPAEFDNQYWKKVKVPDSYHLHNQENEIISALFECDVFINISISKHHASSIYTGVLKNTMGIGTRKTGTYFHLGGEKRLDPVFLSECISDINKIRPADLCIVDSTEFIVTNGPNGPGDMLYKNKVVAGTDPVALDTYCSELAGFFPEDILTTLKAYEAGLGEINLKKLKITEKTL